mgnify:CR=1 FL=1
MAAGEYVSVSSQADTEKADLERERIDAVTIFAARAFPYGAVAADALEIPSMLVIGEYEQYQRRRSIETAVKSMKEAGRNVRLIVYPGVGRGFDFRPPGVRTFADDLATQDATLRAADFMREHLQVWEKE